MANKRELKKAIHAITASLFTECIMFRELIPHTDVDKAEQLLDDILAFQREFLSRIGGYGRMKEQKSAQVYFGELSKDLVSAGQNLFDRMKVLNK